MKHIDLFSGIGGFALAADRTWPEIEHEFWDNDDFCQAVLKKHWPNSKINGDVKQFIADADGVGYVHGESKEHSTEGSHEAFSESVSSSESPFILTGGFPCQPFSQAGRRKGTADDRYLWPAMLGAVRRFKPRWVVAENVAGLVTWNEGLVLETVCSDLEKEGYQVQPFVIPACAVQAPHRRDRIWIIGYAESGTKQTEREIQKRQNSDSRRNDRAVGNTEHARFDGSKNSKSSNERSNDNKKRSNKNEQSERSALARNAIEDPLSKRSRWGSKDYGQILERKISKTKATRPDWKNGDRPDWSKNPLEVASRLCRISDGIPARLDRNPRIHSLGNAIVPQVAAEIFKAIKQIEDDQTSKGIHKD